MCHGSQQRPQDQLTCVAHKHDVVLLGNQGIQEVCQPGGVNSGHKQAGEAVWHVGEAWYLALPGHHAASGIIYIVVKHHSLHATTFCVSRGIPMQKEQQMFAEVLYEQSNQEWQRKVANGCAAWQPPK